MLINKMILIIMNCDTGNDASQESLPVVKYMQSILLFYLNFTVTQWNVKTDMLYMIPLK
jgi:hypothetical protein